MSVPTDLTAEQLQLRIHELMAEVAALCEAAKKTEKLETGMTELRHANQNLVLATLNAQYLQDEAEAVNRKQQQYLSMLAHELRNPLAPIATASAMIAKLSDMSPQVLRLQQIISRQAAHMVRLLDDLLDAARINSGKLTLTMRPVFLTNVIKMAAEAVEAGLTNHEQTLKLHLALEPILLNGDAVRLTQIFSNLLHNACKFGGHGKEIILTSRLMDNEAVVTVQDHGVGIAAEVLPTVFELFSQGPRPLARSDGGLGIGLNIVRNLVGLHNGTVGVYSDGLNSGTTFTVTFPMSHGVQAEGPAALTPVGIKKIRRVLLVEDQQDTREALSGLLELEGHVVSVASDGEAGFAMAMESDHDVLICDIGLPGMDGIELIRRLRNERRHKMPFAIALSGYGEALIQTRAFDAGFDRYLVKPADLDALIRLVSDA